MNKAFVYSDQCEFQSAGEGVHRKILAYGEQLMAVEVHFEEGAVGTLHSHPHTQLSYVLEGEFEFEIDGVRNVVKKGDTLYKLPNVIHGCKCIKKGVLLDIFTPYREDFINK
ncbi:cupin domain-containing protein [Clostridium sp. YIM B02505]|uniref:Cupin domain-containing protein n=1 Tax=Clostridium yunnanense TaxID=2800325 RepID=A0ABS1EKE8_9CLOT|nr:cupin domain-containing protein [Clostridium yunnanense]MBK1809842.1 cupin domain-containing protein [Clostridium yunnanense]